MRSTSATGAAPCVVVYRPHRGPEREARRANNESRAVGPSQTQVPAGRAPSTIRRWSVSPVGTRRLDARPGTLRTRWQGRIVARGSWRSTQESSRAPSPFTSLAPLRCALSGALERWAAKTFKERNLRSRGGHSGRDLARRFGGSRIRSRRVSRLRLCSHLGPPSLRTLRVRPGSPNSQRISRKISRQFKKTQREKNPGVRGHFGRLKSDTVVRPHA
jgi:hypothetical protein